MKFINWLKGLFITAFALLFFVPISAIEKLDTSRPVSLAIVYSASKTPIANASFSLYKVADAIESGTFQLNEQFAGSSAILPETSDPSSWDQSAGTLLGWAHEKNIPASYESSTDAMGKVHFYSIEQGLYLVSASVTKQDGTLYSSAPFLICLPDRDKEGVWNYDVTAWPKAVTSKPVLDLEIVKEWDPKPEQDSVDVVLFKDGKEFETVTLSAKNNWREKFEDLDGNSTWTVSEKNPLNGWKTTTVQKDDQIILTNIKSKTPTGRPSIPFSGNWLPYGKAAGILGVLCLIAALILSFWHKKHA